MVIVTYSITHAAAIYLYLYWYLCAHVIQTDA